MQTYPIPSGFTSYRSRGGGPDTPVGTDFFIDVNYANAVPLPGSTRYGGTGDIYYKGQAVNVGQGFRWAPKARDYIRTLSSLIPPDRRVPAYTAADAGQALRVNADGSAIGFDPDPVAERFIETLFDGVCLLYTSPSPRD